MFYTLLLVTFLISLTVSALVTLLFDRPIASILNRIVNAELGGAWHRYMKFAIYVVGVSGGVRIYQLERYISPEDKNIPVLVLNGQRWTLEVYRTIIETLQSTAWMLLIFFLVSLVAYVIIRAFELKRSSKDLPDK